MISMGETQRITVKFEFHMYDFMIGYYVHVWIYNDIARPVATLPINYKIHKLFFFFNSLDIELNS